MQKPASPRPRKPKSGQRISKPAKDEIAARAWQRMLSGRRLDILNPSPLDIEIEDIAHGLARVSRWNGQTRGKHSFSVAQHCVLVERLVRANAPKLDQKWYLAALLHDAPEYVIGDMITPFKHVLGGIYRDIESGLDRAVNIRFGLPPSLPGDGAAQHQTRRPHGRMVRSNPACRFFRSRSRKDFYQTGWHTCQYPASATISR